MSRIAAGSAEGAEQGYRPYLQAALLMGLFTFLFLCAEYLYVDVLSRMVSGDRAVLAQNEALGVSAVGFLLYPLAERSCRERLRLALLVLSGLAGGLRVRLEEPPVHGVDHVLRDDALHHRPVTAAGWPFGMGLLLAGAMGTAEVTLHKQRKEQRQ